VPEVWVDPGIGFGKTADHNLELLARLPELVERFEEDMNDAVRTVSPIRAVVTVGEAIEVSPERAKGGEGDPLMGAIKVGDLAQRLGGKLISAAGKADRVVESFLIGTMQVENFMTHFRRNKNSAVIVGGDRADVQLVALEGGCPCLVLTGNLYPNDIILTRSEVLEVPIVMVREDTYTVAKKMEAILARHKLRDVIKIKQGAQLVAANLDIAHLKKAAGLA